MPIQEKGGPFGAKKKKKDATDSIIGKLPQKEPPKGKKKPVFEELEEPIEVEDNDLPEELEPLKDEPLEEQSEEEVHQAEEPEPESNDSESDSRNEEAGPEIVEDKESLKEKFSPLPEESGEQDKSTFFDSEAEKIEEPKEEDFAAKGQRKPKKEDFAVEGQEGPKAEEKGFFGAKKSPIYAEENPSSLEDKKRRLGVSERAVNVKAESDASIAKDLFDNEAEDKPEMRKDESQALNIVMVFAIMLLLIAVAASAFLVSGWLSG